MKAIYFPRNMQTILSVDTIWGEKMRKIISLFFAVAFIVVCFSACENPIIAGRKPCNQPNTAWVSQNGTITFSVDAQHHAIGEMQVGGNTVEFYLTNDTGTGIYLFAPSVLDTGVETPEAQYEFWSCSYKSNREFTATVQESTFFSAGDTITFYRVDYTEAAHDE